MATLGEYGAASRRTSGRVVALAGLSAVGFEGIYHSIFCHHPHLPHMMVLFGSHKEIFSEVQLKRENPFNLVFLLAITSHTLSKLYCVKHICLEGQTL